MRQDLLDAITDALRPFDFKDRRGWLREGRCPDCGKRTLWTKADEPWVLRCNRLDSCGYERHVKELFPDIFENWSDRHPKSDEAPNAAADAYLSHARGLRLLGLRGAYTQEDYYSRELGEGSATVRFPIEDWGAPDKPPVSWWERIIDRPGRFGDRKARFAPGKSYAGYWWAYPGDTPEELAKAREIWIVEGIFDAIALRQHGITAVAALTCTNYPEVCLERLKLQPHRPPLIWALDSDQAGRRAIREYVDRSRAEGWEAHAAQIPQPARRKVDWNDLHLRTLTPAGDDAKPPFGQDALDHYFWLGDLLLARSAPEKAVLLFQRSSRSTFPFDFERRIWWANIDPAKVAETKQLLQEEEHLSPEEAEERAVKKVAKVTTIANCHPRPLYFQRDPATDESLYYYQVDLPGGGPSIKDTFTPSAIAAADAFKKRLLTISPLSTFTGNTAQLDRLLDMQKERLKIVEAIGYVGYSREHGAYVFNDLAVKDGRLIPLNSDDYFDLGPVAVKSLDRSVGLEITPWTGDQDMAWVDHLWKAFGPKGLVVLAYWFGALYAEQVRQQWKSWPFLELAGEYNTGKTTLIEFLWKLCGRANYEGFDPSKSSMSGRTRAFAQVGNLPVVLMEGDRDEDTARAKKFDFEELKSLYNGRSVRTRGVKSGGNETYEPPFRGAIVIEQNRPVAASDAVLSRLVAVTFDGAGYNADTKKAADRLETLPLEEVSGFIVEAAKAERKVLEVFAEAYPAYEASLMASPRVAHRRIAKCHGQLAGMLEALGQVIQISGDRMAAAQSLIVEMAEQRKLAIAADHPIVEAFWEAYDFIGVRRDSEYTDHRLNHSPNVDQIAVNLNEFAAVAGELRLPYPDLPLLKAHLRSSKVRRFVACRDVRSANTKKTLHCWVFEKPGAAHAPFQLRRD